MTIDIFWIFISIIAGVMIGLVNYFILWKTVNLGVNSSKGPLIFFISLIVRTFCVLICFYFVSGSNAFNLIGCAIGFTLARTLGIKLAKSR